MIVFRGAQTFVEERISCSLEPLDPYRREFETELWVDVTDADIEGVFSYHVFELPGAPSSSGP